MPVLVILLTLAILGCAARILLLGNRPGTTPEERAAKRRAINRTAATMFVCVGALVVVEFLV